MDPASKWEKIARAEHKWLRTETARIETRFQRGGSCDEITLGHVVRLRARVEELERICAEMSH